MSTHGLAGSSSLGCAPVRPECGVCLHTSETSGVGGLCGLPAPPPPPPSPQHPFTRKACLLPSAACNWFGDQPHSSEEGQAAGRQRELGVPLDLHTLKRPYPLLPSCSRVTSPSPFTRRGGEQAGGAPPAQGLSLLCFPEAPAGSDRCCCLAESWSWGSGCPSVLAGMAGAVLLGADQNSYLSLLGPSLSYFHPQQ